MIRQDILDAAAKCVNGDRDRQYGSPEDSFQLVASFWNAYLGIPNGEGIKPRDVAAMMALLKIARISGPACNSDNWIDLAGYAACGGEVESKTPLNG